MVADLRDRCLRARYDAIVVGSGPNGLAAAITAARAGRSVLLLEAEKTIGGGCRTEEVTLPGFRHDICSAIHPLGVASPFFRSLDLESLGVEWIQPPAQFAQPLDDGNSPVAYRSVRETARTLGPDSEGYRRLMEPLVEVWRPLLDQLLGPLRLPRHPILFARFGMRAFLPAAVLARLQFKGVAARALLSGAAAHSELPLSYPFTAGFGLTLVLLAHAVGWAIPRGGSQRISDALAAHLRSLGGEIVTGARVRALEDLPSARDIFLDITPRQLLAMAESRLPSLYRAQLARFRYGPGVFKIDYALDGPVPWRDGAVARAGTVHVGGTLEEVARSEAAVNRGVHPERPYVLFAQQSLFDPTRAPAGKQTAWAYCHVPNGSVFDMTDRMERQIERFAPGFRDLVLCRHVNTPSGFERHNANYIGGDINGGAMTLRQTYTRPVVSRDPYRTPIPGVYLCSSSTPPGGGVHGMSGYWAVRSALRHGRP